VAADAKRGEIYLGARSARGESIVAPELIAAESVTARIAALAKVHGQAFALAGTAAEIIAPSLVQAVLRPIDSLVRQPDAIFVAKLAAHAPIGPPPKPLYLRAPDAKLPGAAL
jgi:tRNA threonylcarbamoyladenosine biosynthesis protein TsaB